MKERNAGTIEIIPPKKSLTSALLIWSTTPTIERIKITNLIKPNNVIYWLRGQYFYIYMQGVSEIQLQNPPTNRETQNIIIFKNMTTNSKLLRFRPIAF